MRIRKRTPASAWVAASPPPSPPPLPLQQPTEKPREEDKEAEEKRAIHDAGEDNDDQVHPAPAPVAAAASGDRNRSATTDDVPKPAPQEQEQDAAVRCSRTDGKRWRCKKAAAPGYLFCDRHIAWSTRKRKPRTKSHGSRVVEPTTTTTIPMEDHREA